MNETGCHVIMEIIWEVNMAYRYGNRYQISMFPESIDEYVPLDSPVRAYDIFVETLKFRKLGIDLNSHKVGNSEYDPKAMLKLLIYGYSYGVKSSRKLEREVNNNLTFIWLMGGLKPDHKTISEFRRRNKKPLKKVLKHCARLCIDLGLIAGNVLFVDGTKIRANASRGATHDKEYYKLQLSKLDSKIDKLLNECDAVDMEESDLGSFVSMDKELSDAKKLKEKINDILNKFNDENRNQVNATDSDCSLMRSVQGSHASYNVQSVVDDENGLIVHADALNAPADNKQLSSQIEQANEVLDDKCEVACADAGYADTNDLKNLDDQDIKVIVPTQRQALRDGEKAFSKREFVYNSDKDCYYCPQGHELRYTSTDTRKNKRNYIISNKNLCFSCKHYGKCTDSKKGRTVSRLINEEIREKLEAQYEEESSQEIYSRRKNRVEHPFGHIKRNLKTDAFLLRGRSGVQAETSLLATCFNIARMVTILGVGGMIERLSALSAV